ncbi:MAG: phosphoribosylaminoimidazolesuccinocarboxamide synthase [Clostridiales bacterium]|jgi:phosphoribosylaminoimidazole-succinocarboxamide synthase|nr:phosphoribosylaminoimidazolesuccinocarboxamide synthase [Clostridiales bacterium]
MGAKNDMEPKFKGKVRDIYDISEDRMIIVTTDRISAFDVILPTLVTGKGVTLNGISNFWFKKTERLVKNHIISSNLEDMPEYFHQEKFRDRTVMVQKLKILPFEFVVRGYIFGNMWKYYEEGKPFCGHRISGEYQMAQKLEAPILTPSTKVETGHDEYVDIDSVKTAIGAELTDKIAEISLGLYAMCSQYAMTKGILIADSKFEFGLDKNNQLVLADELFTPDSSRFWDAADYRVGVSPKSYDKQFIRDWLLNNKKNGEFQFDGVPGDVIERTAQIYRECLQKLVGGEA